MRSIYSQELRIRISSSISTRLTGGFISRPQPTILINFSFRLLWANASKFCSSHACLRAHPSHRNTEQIKVGPCLSYHPHDDYESLVVAGLFDGDGALLPGYQVHQPASSALKSLVADNLHSFPKLSLRNNANSLSSPRFASHRVIARAVRVLPHRYLEMH